MKICTYKLLLFTCISIFFFSCKDDDNDFKMSASEQQQYINEWIYENMSVYYYWNDHIPSNPNYNRNTEKFFESLLYKYNTADGDRFSWIQENYIDLLNALSGYSPSDIGFEHIFLKYENDPSVYARILYVKPDTDAERAGLKRGMDIATVNGSGMTVDNYQTVFRRGLDQYKLGIVVQEGIHQVTIKSAKNYAENPILLHTIFDFNVDKTGYVVYNFFASDKGDDSYSYDRQLADIFSKFQQEGVRNLVLDLRYNNGGATESALYIASALVPDRKKENIFANYEYNSTLMSQLSNVYKHDYFTDKVNNRYAIPRLGDQLEKVYIITGEWSASSSEMLINGLNSYMKDKIVLIGDNTYGKNVASITLIEENSKYKPYNKCGMQPIVAKVSNADAFSDYAAGFSPDFPMPELQYPMYELGNMNEPLLATALRLIADGEDRAVPLRSLPYAPNVLQKKKSEKDFNMYISPERFKGLIIKE